MRTLLSLSCMMLSLTLTTSPVRACNPPLVDTLPTTPSLAGFASYSSSYTDSPLDPALTLSLLRAQLSANYVDPRLVGYLGAFPYQQRLNFLSNYGGGYNNALFFHNSFFHGVPFGGYGHFNRFNTFSGFRGHANFNGFNAGLGLNRNFVNTNVGRTLGNRLGNRVEIKQKVKVRHR